MRSSQLRALVATATLIALVFIPALPARAAITSHVADGKLLVTGDDSADVIVIECTGGSVQVNDVAPDNGSAMCSEIRAINVSGGGGGDEIDLSAVDSLAFGLRARIHLDGGDGDDIIVGSSWRDSLRGGAGVDTLRGGGKGDRLHPDADGGSVSGGGGDTDHVFVQGEGEWMVTDVQIERLAPDPLVIPIASVESVSIRTGPGNDRIDASEYNGHSNLYGEDGDDELIGGRRSDSLAGWWGDDRLIGNAGNDFISGYQGEDFLRGGPGRDYLVGGADTDDCMGGPGVDDGYGCVGI